MTDDADRLRYALSKQLPDVLERGGVLSSAYGDLPLDPEAAGIVVERLRPLLQARLAALEGDIC